MSVSIEWAESPRTGFMESATRSRISSKHSVTAMSASRWESSSSSTERTCVVLLRTRSFTSAPVPPAARVIIDSMDESESVKRLESSAAASTSWSLRSTRNLRELSAVSSRRSMVVAACCAML